MKNDPMHLLVTKVVDTFLSEPVEFSVDDICVEIHDLGIDDEGEIRRLTFAAIREILRRGAQVDFHSGTPSGIDHPDNKVSTDEIIDRIRREWDALGQRPSVYGEICVFVWTPEAMEAYETKRAAAP